MRWIVHLGLAATATMLTSQGSACDWYSASVCVSYDTEQSCNAATDEYYAAGFEAGTTTFSNAQNCVWNTGACYANTSSHSHSQFGCVTKSGKVMRGGTPAAGNGPKFTCSDFIGETSGDGCSVGNDTKGWWAAFQAGSNSNGRANANDAICKAKCDTTTCSAGSCTSYCAGISCSAGTSFGVPEFTD